MELSQKDIAVFPDFCVNFLLKQKPNDIETGFVIAGFGEEEYLPELRDFVLESSVYNVHKVRYNPPRNVLKEPALIVLFAQTDMIETFVRGRENDIDRFLLRFIAEAFEEEKENTNTDIHAFIDSVCTRIQQRFLARLNMYTIRNFLIPLRNTVSSLPKEDLASMAEALIYLTIIKRHTTPSMETVGGAVDVAVISKGDGFVWIKRKHYFKPEYNQAYLQKYFFERNPPERNTP